MMKNKTMVKAALATVLLAIALAGCGSKKTEENAQTQTQQTSEAQTQAPAEAPTEAQTEAPTEEQEEEPAVVPAATPQTPEEILAAEASAEKTAYLTFDDCPVNPETTELLDCLDNLGVKATFFCIATQPNCDEIMADIVRRGHTIAIHSVSHDYSDIYSSNAAFRNDVLSMQQFIKDATGVTTNFYRFPGGSSNSIHKKYGEVSMSGCVNWLESNGFSYWDWNVSSGDADGKASKEDVINNILEGCECKTEAVILMHSRRDTRTTLEAIPEVVAGLRERGFTILPLTENTKPVHHNQSD